MGMNTRGGGSSNKTYLSVFSNQLVMEYSKREDLEKKLESLSYLGLDPEKIQERQKTKGKNEGQTVYYYVVYDVEGLLTNMSIDETDWGDMVQLEFTDVDEKFVISLGDSFGRISKDFIRRVGNLDLSKEINFGIWELETEDGKKRSGVKMYQDDEKIEYFLTYDDMPEPVQKKRGRKVEWDYSEQESFLFEELVKFVDENFKSSVDEKPKKKVEKEEEPKKSRKPRKPATKKQIEEEDDDLPF